MDHKREHRTPPPLARVMGVGRQQQQPPSLFVLPVCAYGGVMGYFMCFSSCVSFVSCIVMMSGWVLFLVPKFCF